VRRFYGTKETEKGKDSAYIQTTSGISSGMPLPPSTTGYSTLTQGTTADDLEPKETEGDERNEKKQNKNEISPP